MTNPSDAVRPLLAALVLFAGLALAPACGPEPFEADTSIEAAPTAPLSIASPLACALDADCAPGLFCYQGACARQCETDAECEGGGTCSPRGRCETPVRLGQDEGVTDVAPGVRLAVLPDRMQYVARGAAEITVQVTTDLRPPKGELTYRVERTDGAGDATRVRTAQGDTSFPIVIESGAADPAGAEPKVVETYVVTSAGAFALTLVPALPFSGIYAGEVHMDAFGGTGLPLRFQIVTTPPDAGLGEAEEAFLVLRVAEDALFAPHDVLDPSNPEERVIRPLTFDDFTGRWVATSTAEYRLGQGSLLSGARPGQVRRSLRFELEPDGSGGLMGSIADHWTGLFDSRTAGGNLAPATISMEGTLSLRRVGGAPDLADVTPPEPLVDADPQPLPLPEVGACAAVTFPEGPVGGYGCGSITSATDFVTAGAADQGSCAIAVANEALAGATTAQQIAAFLDDSVDNPGGMSFAEFIEACAAGTDGYCQPTGAVLCARQLAARAYVGADQSLDLLPDLLDAYQRTTNEAFLGRQLAAFHSDAQTRLEWLRTSNYPAVVTSAVQDLVGQLLDDWSESVLEVHLGVLGGMLDPAGLAVMTRAPLGAEATDARKRLLVQMSQGWRGATDAVTLGTARWNQLLQAETERTGKAAYVSERMFDLYLVAGILVQLNRDAGTGFASAGFGGGFGNLMRSLNALTEPFDVLVYARDAEVVVPTSLDPESTNATLLTERREGALGKLDAAHEGVQTLVAEAAAEALDQARLTNEMTNQINDLRDELVELCGLPVGCTASDFRTDPACAVRAAPGECGFLIAYENSAYLDFQAGAQSVSEGGRALLAIRDAVLQHTMAMEQRRAHGARTALRIDRTDAFAREVEGWNEKRRELMGQVKTLIEQRGAERDDELQALLENIEQRQARRAEAIVANSLEVAEWNTIRVNGVKHDFQALRAASALEQTGGALRDTADSIDQLAATTADGFPTSVGLSNDVFAPARLAVRLASYGVSSGMRMAARVTEATAAGIEDGVAYRQALREAELTHLSEASAVSDMITEADLARLAEAAEAAGQRSELEDKRMADLIALLRQEAEADLAYARDTSELNDRISAIQELLVEEVGLELQVWQAELGITAAVHAYLEVAQRAQLRNARLADLQRQRAQINELVGSPDAVFQWAHRLEDADAMLLSAKGAMMDWLVALEYLAVRPFLDSRLQILLARNTFQLREIAAELRRLEGSCGGPISRHTSELSVRGDLLSIADSFTDPVTAEVSSPGQRFRDLLARGYVPIDKRVRYTADGSVGQLLTSRDVLAAAFDIRLRDFANLAASCNAKVASLEVQLVGAGLGTAQPTVTVLYDGTSYVHSCQPGLDAYLETIGRDATAFGSTTTLHAAGRSLSPVAGINAWPAEGTANMTLSGLPLASQYTILIDPAMGENPKIDWSKLEDVKLRLHYTYQDPFPAGQCQ